VDALGTAECQVRLLRRRKDDDVCCPGMLLVPVSRQGCSHYPRRRRRCRARALRLMLLLGIVSILVRLGIHPLRLYRIVTRTRTSRDLAASLRVACTSGSYRARPLLLRWRCCKYPGVGSCFLCLGPAMPLVRKAREFVGVSGADFHGSHDSIYHAITPYCLLKYATMSTFYANERSHSHGMVMVSMYVVTVRYPDGSVRTGQF
jgi:hypothetical protein